MKALTICPRQKLMHVLGVISMETLYQTIQKPGTRMVHFNFRRNHCLPEMGFRKGLYPDISIILKLVTKDNLPMSNNTVNFVMFYVHFKE